MHNRPLPERREESPLSEGETGATDFSEVAAAAGCPPLAARRLSHRAFLKTLAALVGGAGLGHLATSGQQADAVYIRGDTGDTIDTNLTVQGNLTVEGEARMGANVLAGTDGVAKQTFYAGDVQV